MSSDTKKKMGRPRLDTHELKMRLDRDTLARLQEYADSHGGNRQDAVKSMIEQCLAQFEGMHC